MDRVVNTSGDVRIIAAMGAIWLLGIFALWIGSNLMTEERPQVWRNSTSVYEVMPEAFIPRQDLSARFTVLERFSVRRDIVHSPLSRS